MTETYFIKGYRYYPTVRHTLDMIH